MKTTHWAFLTGLLWGLCEATWFFIVPDILLCYWAMKSARLALAATLAVVVGAGLGAVVLYALFSLPGDWANELPKLWSCLPGYAPKMSEVAANQLAERGAKGLLSGPASGIPYRAYVHQAWLQQIPLFEILLWTPIARLERVAFAPVIVLALRWILVGLVAKRVGTPVLWSRILCVLITIYWIGLYFWYWRIFLSGTYQSS